MDVLDPSIPVLVRTARSVLNWSQGELARRSGVASNTIGRFERYEGPGRASNIKKLIEAFEESGVRFRSDEIGFGVAIEGELAISIRLSIRAQQLSDDNVKAKDGTKPPSQTRVRKRHSNAKTIMSPADIPKIPKRRRKLKFDE